MASHEKLAVSGKVTVKLGDHLATVKKVTLKDGIEKSVLEFWGLREVLEKNEQGTWETKEPQYVRVLLWNAPERCADLVKDGLVLFVRGNLVEEQYFRKDGTEATSHVLTAWSIGADITQSGLKYEN